LLEEGRCIAYDARPLACRGVNSYDAAACERTFDHPDQDLAVPAYPPQAQIAGAIRAGIALGSTKNTLDGRLLELNPALRIALDDATLGDVWTKGKKCFSAARDREEDRSGG